MFTWNFQYVSNAKLAETFSQLMLSSQEQDVLVRIHTAIHSRDEALTLARFIKGLLPKAHIFGTSTSAVIYGGKLFSNQCLISVSLMTSGYIKSGVLQLLDPETGAPYSPDILCNSVKDAVVTDDTSLLLTFLSGRYLAIHEFVEKSNELFPGVQMTGGIANTGEDFLLRGIQRGFVFNETGVYDNAVIVASINGPSVENCTSYASGAAPIGEEMEITESFGNCILTIDGKEATGNYFAGIDDDFGEKSGFSNLFPFVYTETENVPIFINYSGKKSLSEILPPDIPQNKPFYESRPEIDIYSDTGFLSVDHAVRKGRKVRRAFIYDRNIVQDCRALFRKIENFKKAETLFAYSCIIRSMIYSNCAKWELSVYEKTNISGCITLGEIINHEGRNIFGNCTFVISAVGENDSRQEFNPYAFSHTDALSADNRDLIKYLTYMETRFEKDQKMAAADSIKAFVRDCEMSVLYSANEELPNFAALSIDMKTKSYDRVCVIKVTDVESMHMVFTEQNIDLTYRWFLGKCTAFARWKHYNVYLINKWQLAIAAANYLVSLNDFVSDMEILQNELFESNEENIAIVPLFCVLDGCNSDNFESTFVSAYMEMRSRNNQFFVKETGEQTVDVDQIREKYHMVNVINYAITHDKVIPYFQGIYDNKQKKINHYESLMRIADEKGTIYYPGSFLEVARSYGLLYDSLSSAMVHKVFEKFKDSVSCSVSINLGMRDIRNKKLTDYIYGFLSTVMHPENFVFEILENEDIDDYDALMSFVDTIHQLGGLVSIDDFGSGFSNLKHIASIHSDYIKIDGSIVRKCSEDPELEKLVALISGWKNLSLHKVSIIAEFVENNEIQEVLMRYDIDYSQGYLFARPQPEIDIDRKEGSEAADGDR